MFNILKSFFDNDRECVKLFATTFPIANVQVAISGCQPLRRILPSPASSLLSVTSTLLRLLGTAAWCRL